MPSITNVGGSISSAVALTLLAWAIRTVRGASQRRQRGSESQAAPVVGPKAARFACSLKPAALRMLVETVPLSYVLVDARTDSEGGLPPGLQHSQQITGHELQHSSAASSSSGASQPKLAQLAVVVGGDAKQMQDCAADAAHAGFRSVAILEGGLAAYANDTSTQADLKYLSRDALGLLLGLCPASPPPEGPPLLLDVRRPDERALFGSIPGSISIPAVQLPSALQVPGEEFQRQYRTSRPHADDLVVVYSRTHTRAAWAAQVAADAGLHNCFVLLQGVNGWHLHSGTRAYRAYGEDEAPPEPEPLQVRPVDVVEGRRHLYQSGILMHRTRAL